MRRLEGKGVYAGVAIGPVRVYERSVEQAPQYQVEDVSVELARFHEAQEQVRGNLQVLYAKAQREVGEEEATIFEMHQMMLADPEFVQTVEQHIKESKLNAERAVELAGQVFATRFASMEDEYMQARATDVRDIARQLVEMLCHKGAECSKLYVRSIIVADDLTPSETLLLDKKMVLAFVTSGGSTNSHTAILARTLGIPAVVGVGASFTTELNGQQIIVDGETGEVYLDPEATVLQALQEKQVQLAGQRQELEEWRHKETKTSSGQRLQLYANIGQVEDLPQVLANDAEGIGLFRSEFLYLERESYPTEEELFQAYKQVVEAMQGKRVIIRTLDIGADKQVGYFQLPAEENPALGLRAIRVCLQRPEIFTTQLRAILRASAFGKVAVMFPMIISLEEVRQARCLLEGARRQLAAEGIAYDESLEIGIMIETPAAAILSDELAGEVDFFSIGTNDLTQYTLAVDRQNVALESLVKSDNKAILRLIKQVIANAHAAGIWVGICGELAAAPELTETFLAMGVDELSVAPATILPMRKAISCL